jgi:hypothetical protein
MKRESREKVTNQISAAQVMIKKCKGRLQLLWVKSSNKRSRVVKIKTGTNLKTRRRKSRHFRAIQHRFQISISLIMISSATHMKITRLYCQSGTHWKRPSRPKQKQGSTLHSGTQTAKSKGDYLQKTR